MAFFLTMVAVPKKDLDVLCHVSKVDACPACEGVNVTMRTQNKHGGQRVEYIRQMYENDSIGIGDIDGDDVAQGRGDIIKSMIRSDADGENCGFRKIDEGLIEDFKNIQCGEEVAPDLQEEVCDMQDYVEFLKAHMGQYVIVIGGR